MSNIPEVEHPELRRRIRNVHAAWCEHARRIRVEPPSHPFESLIGAAEAWLLLYRTEQAMHRGPGAANN